MKYRLVIDGNAVYEIDEECINKKGRDKECSCEDEAQNNKEAGKAGNSDMKAFDIE